MAASSRGAAAETHLRTLSRLRETREFRHGGPVVCAITAAVEHLLSAQVLGAVLTPPQAAEPALAPQAAEQAPDCEAVQREEPADTHDDRSSWEVAVADPPLAPPPSRAAMLKEHAAVLARRMSTSEARARARRILANAAAARRAPREGEPRSATSPETVDALRAVGRSGQPAAFNVVLYV